MTAACYIKTAVGYIRYYSQELSDIMLENSEPAQKVNAPVHKKTTYEGGSTRWKVFR